MGFVFLQGNKADSGGSTVASEPCAYSSDVVRGSLLVATVSWVNTDVTNLATAMTDSALNNWQLAIALTRSGGTDEMALFYAVSGTAGPNTVTFTPHTSSAFVRFSIHEYSCLHPVLDQVATGTGPSATSATTGSATTNAANELIFGNVFFNGSTTTLEGTFTPRETTSVASQVTGDKIGVAPGSYVVSGTCNAPQVWSAVMATFYESVSIPHIDVTIGA